VVISCNGVELYRESMSLQQMLAVGDVKVGDVIEILMECEKDEKSSMTVSAAILNENRFREGYEVLNASTLELTHFEDTLVEGTVNCNRDGLLYTSIPQNGNWSVQVDGENAEIILVLTENEALVFAVDGIVPYIQSELVKIGRDGVKCRRAEIAPSYEAERAYEDMTVHVSSMRLDGIVNQLTGEGRAASAELILRGLVDQNYFTSENVSAEVKPGDIISVRGYGKFVIGEADGTTRSGRLRVHCRKYI